MTCKYNGKFITLEGPEGSGKSTQAGVIASLLSGLNMDIVRTREPGGVSIAEQLREMLLDPDNRIAPRTELLLYASGRAQHTEELILPALREGKYVICERYIHASLAYQGYGRKLDLALIGELNTLATGGLKPDITIVLDIDVREGLKRVKASCGRLDRLEAENIEFHERVRNGYKIIAETDPDVVIVSAEGPKEEVSRRITDILRERHIAEV